MVCFWLAQPVTRRGASTWVEEVKRDGEIKEEIEEQKEANERAGEERRRGRSGRRLAPESRGPSGGATGRRTGRTWGWRCEENRDDNKVDYRGEVDGDLQAEVTRLPRVPVMFMQAMNIPSSSLLGESGTSSTIRILYTWGPGAPGAGDRCKGQV